LFGRVFRPLAVVLELTKFRLSGLVVATTVAGYVLASRAPFSWAGLAAVAVGTALAALGANGLNQWWEAERDALMLRTRERPIPSGQISRRAALGVALALALCGVGVLAVFSNLLTAALGAGVVALYVLVYTPLKPRTSLATLVGAVVGAVPPVMGWTAAAGGVGPGAWILFAILFAWQIPHFLALAWMYREDYGRGGYRMLPIGDPGGRVTFPVIVLYALALVPLGAGAFLTGTTGAISAAGGALLGCWFAALTLRLNRQRDDGSARRVFLASLAYLPLLLTLMMADRAPASAAYPETAGPAQRVAGLPYAP